MYIDAIANVGRMNVSKIVLQGSGIPVFHFREPSELQFTKIVVRLECFRQLMRTHRASQAVRRIFGQVQIYVVQIVVIQFVVDGQLLYMLESEPESIM